MRSITSILTFTLFTFCFTAKSQTFQEVSDSSGIAHLCFSTSKMGAGVAFFDYNNDDLLDIYLTGGYNTDKLYRNLGNGNFMDVSTQAGLGITSSQVTMGVATGDIDNDGFKDIFITTWGAPGAGMGNTSPNILLKNNGNGTFSDISTVVGINDSAWSLSASFGDYNLDGWLDVYVGNYVDTTGVIYDSLGQIVGFSHTGQPNFLYLNNGNGTFTEVAEYLNVNDIGTALSVAFTDFDNDHDMDIYVANDFGEWNIPNRLFRNEYPLDSFTEVSVQLNANAAIYGMGIAIGDYDEDLDLDYYVTNLGRNVLYNQGANNIFQDVTNFAGVTNQYTVDSLLTTGWGATFFDFENNTYLDLFVTNGQIPSAPFIATHPKDANKLYKNNFDGTFTDVSILEGVSDSSFGRGFSCGDYDNDGDLDLLVGVVDNDINSSFHTLLYRNDLTNGNHWVKVKLRGIEANRDGYGSLVRIVTGGRSFIREIDGGSSHASNNSSIAHFGLGTYTIIDSLIVTWPGGKMQYLTSLSVDSMYYIIEQMPPQIFTNLQYIICQGDSIFIGGDYQNQSGIYYDTLVSQGGIDSIIVSDLVVIPFVINNLQSEICEGDSLLIFGAYKFTAGYYSDTFQSIIGCDSFVNHTLWVLQVEKDTIHITICERDSFFAGGTFQTITGYYEDSLITSAGCDSVIITNLLVLSATVDSIIVELCEGDTILYSGAQLYKDTIFLISYLNDQGCDSLILIEVTAHQKVINYENIEICEGDSILLSGAYQNLQGTYFDSMYTSIGCDSVIITSLAVNENKTVDTTIVIDEGDSVYVGGAYQSVSGLFADSLLTSQGCDSVRYTELHVMPINSVSASEHFDNLEFKAFPNPAKEIVKISYNLPQKLKC